MATKFPEIFAALARPFSTQEVKARKGGGGQVLHYITMRTAQNRFDEVLGPESWRVRYTETRDGIKCGIAIRLGDSDEWIEKEDGGGFAGMPAEDDNEKSGYADAFKRAAVTFGVGRYLYRDGVPHFEADHQPTNGHPITEQAIESAGFTRQPDPVASTPPPVSGGSGSYGNLPRAARQMFPWAKDQGAAAGIDLVKYLNSWAKLQDFPFKMTEWDDEQVKLGVAEAVRKLDSLSGGSPAPAPPPSANNQVPASFTPDGSIPMPAKGGQLYYAAKDAQDKHGVTFVQTLNNWGKATGKADRTADWTGKDLEDGWRFLCYRVQTHLGTAGNADMSAPSSNGVDLAPLKRELMAKSKRHHNIVYQQDPTDDQAKASLASVYKDVAPDEQLSSADGSKLAKLSAMFDELIKEASEVPF